MDQEKYKQRLNIDFDKEENPILVLENWMHRDYIEDVLCEHYDIEYEYMVVDEKSGKYTLFFGSKISSGIIKSAIEKINNYHSTEKELYSV
jgi:hypothetical protein